QVTPALVSGTYHWVLAFAAEHLSTPAVYAACDRLRAGQADRDEPAAGAAASQPAAGPRTAGPPAAGQPAGGQPAGGGAPPRGGGRRRLGRALAAGREQGALGAIVSGSGPTCAYLARDGAHARDLAVALTSAGVCRTVASVSGPAPGATVLS